MRRTRRCLRTLALLCPVALALVGPSSVRGAEEPRLTLGPGAFTFPEIAGKLSAQGRSVRLARGLENRAAFVYLKQRPWSEARAVLAAGLDLRFREPAQGHSAWLIERDPVVLARERRWRVQLTRNLLAQLEWKVGAQEALAREFAGWTVERIKAEEKRLAQQFVAVPEDDPRRAILFAQLQRLCSAAEALSASGRLVRPWLRELLRRSPVDLVQSREALTLTPVAQWPADLITAAIDEAAARQRRVLEPEIVLSGLRFQRDGGMGVAPVLLLISPRDPFAASIDSLGTGVHPRVDPDGRDYLAEAVFVGVSRPDAPLQGLGQDAVAWLAREQGATDAVLKSERVRRPFRSGSVLPLNSLSQLVESWSRAADAEAVMEVLPGAEGLDRPLGGSSRSPEGREFTLAKLWARGGEWMLGEQHGVLLVRDSLAFVDRAVEFPLPALLRLERSVTARLGAERESARQEGRPVPKVPHNLPRTWATEAELRDYYRTGAVPRRGTSGQA